MEQLQELILYYAGTFALLATVFVPMVTEALFTYVWQPVNKVLNKVVILIVALILTFAAWQLSVWQGVGFLAEITVWWHVALYGIGAGATASWTWANWETVKLIIQFIIAANAKAVSAKRK
jgi:hypothetical protein